jgi:hypothetical protein
MVEGEGGELGTGLLSESSGTITGSSCMILGDVGAGDTENIDRRSQLVCTRIFV